MHSVSSILLNAALLLCDFTTSHTKQRFNSVSCAMSGATTSSGGGLLLLPLLLGRGERLRTSGIHLELPLWLSFSRLGFSELSVSASEASSSDSRGLEARCSRGSVLKCVSLKFSMRRFGLQMGTSVCELLKSAPATVSWLAGNVAGGVLCKPQAA